ncbi:NADH oxidase [Desulfosporosinus sp. HMP52]|uniref:oxidoreductase n=1 Tax=Desulfosporosinus sp. HMP52 TaxID=1487923 RepID=UPI00051FE7A0|nr:NADH:flavin oxidoreductase [Desulfosporosinus sp. HMP52]KGK91074.1 NADH oxidase [Desulfosporosinus sp. HMP52]
MAHLLDTLQAGSLTLHNRLIMPPMATAKSEEDGGVSKAVLDYYQEKSKGGCFSLIIVEHSFVSPKGKASKNQLSVSNDHLVEGLRSLAQVIHSNGSKAVMQINHAGSATSQEVIGEIPVAPSPVPHPWNGNTPKELSKQEITDIVQAFQDAARRVKEAGFDGVEIHSAHGYLLNQFFSPLSNQRTDEYGGTIHNRLRLHLQVIAAVKAVVGNDFPLLLRLGSCDYKEGGITIEDSQIAAKEFEKAGITILDISGSFLGYKSPGSSEQGYFSPLTEAIKKVVSIPVILTGGITEPQAAEKLLGAEKADLIGVGRAVLQDSQWAKKAIETLR